LAQGKPDVNVELLPVNHPQNRTIAPSNFNLNDSAQTPLRHCAYH